MSKEKVEGDRAPVPGVRQCKYCKVWYYPNEMAGPTSKVCVYCIDDHKITLEREQRAERRNRR